MKKTYFLFFFALLFLLPSARLTAGTTNKGDLSNLVCFVRFEDEGADDVFNKPFSEYQQIFNDDREDAVSMFNYFKVSSYGQLSWRSQFFPAPQGDKVMSYRSKFPREWYEPYVANINDYGYKTDIEAAARLQALAKEVAGYLDENLPEDMVVDADGDGFVDNLTIVFSGNSDISAKKLFWPKRMDLITGPGKEIYIRGKRFVGYLMVFDEANGYGSGFRPLPLSLGLICHESSHSLGTYDLYHVNDNNNPVGSWDLMSNQGNEPQQMTVFTKMKYCKWVDEIPTISKPGSYTLNPVNGPSRENIAYKIQPVGNDEYFVVEYRKKGLFDTAIPESGLIVYRINPKATGGNVNYNGKTVFDETYVFRPGGTMTADGDIDKAAFSQESGRTKFGGTAELKPFYSDGTEANFAISNVSACGETISFTLEETGNRIVLSETAITLGGAEGSAGNITVASDVDWTISGVPEWITPSMTEGTAGSATLSLVANSNNTATQSRTAVITISDKGGSGLSKQFTVVQKSNVLSEPSGLKAEQSGQSVSLTWSPVPVGKKILTEDFENTANPNGWELKNLGSRGWHWQPKSNAYKAYEGNYSAALWSAWDDAHQDETLTSPTLNNATTLVFQSCHKGMGLDTPKNPQEYNVEVSSDDGATWTVLAEVRSLGGSEVRNKYMEVVFDLTEYASDRMRIRFHAFDKPLDPANPLGLSYDWMVDNIEIYGAGALKLTGYNVYRNGKLLGTTKTPSFVDEAPAKGDNVYTVTAVSSLGESSPSAPVTMQIATGINTVAGNNAQVVAVYTLDGIQVGTSLGAMPKGLYIVKTVDAQGKTAVRKVVVK